ncbi:hypothetical protein SMICM304S_02534 [Streptomyces microflavus]
MFCWPRVLLVGGGGPPVRGRGVLVGGLELPARPGEFVVTRPAGAPRSAPVVPRGPSRGGAQRRSGVGGALPVGDGLPPGTVRYRTRSWLPASAGAGAGADGGAAGRCGGRRGGRVAGRGGRGRARSFRPPGRLRGPRRPRGGAAGAGRRRRPRPPRRRAPGRARTVAPGGGGAGRAASTRTSGRGGRPEPEVWGTGRVGEVQEAGALGSSSPGPCRRGRRVSGVPSTCRPARGGLLARGLRASSPAGILERADGPGATGAAGAVDGAGRGRMPRRGEGRRPGRRGPGARRGGRASTGRRRHASGGGCGRSRRAPRRRRGG